MKLTTEQLKQIKSWIEFNYASLLPTSRINVATGHVYVGPVRWQLVHALAEAEQHAKSYNAAISLDDAISGSEGGL